MTIMACLRGLKSDINFLESTFPKEHSRFQIVSASLDELACRFVDKKGDAVTVFANITVSIYFLFHF